MCHRHNFISGTRHKTTHDVYNPCGADFISHYSDVIMGAMASQIISVSIVYSTVCSGADQRKHQSSASLAFVRGIHRWPVNSPQKGPVTRKMFPLDDVIMGCYVRHILALNRHQTNFNDDSWFFRNVSFGCTSFTWDRYQVFVWAGFTRVDSIAVRIFFSDCGMLNSGQPFHYAWPMPMAEHRLWSS